MIRELTGVDEFREAMRRRQSIVITDSARAPRYHATPWSCEHVTEDYFRTKVIDHGGRQGGYFAVGTFAEAESRWPGLVMDF
jgi:hypothetical protein